MSFLGLNFSKTSGKSSSISDLNKTENIFQQSSQNTNSTQNSSTNSQQDSTGSTVSTQTGSTASDVNKTSTGAGTTSLFDDKVLGGLQDTVLSMLSGAKDASPVDLAGLSSFNKDAYVNGTVDAASSKIDSGLDASLGGIGDMVGSKEGNSSTATLLANRARGDAASTIAGVRAQAEATGNSILNQNAQTTIGAKASTDNMLTQLLAALKGGTQTTATSGSEGTKGTTTTAATGTTDTAESTKMASTSLQTIQSLVEALLNGTNTTVAHETSSGKTSGTTMGASAQLGGK